MDLAKQPIQPELWRAEVLIGLRVTDTRRGATVHQSLEQFTLMQGDTPEEHLHVEQLFALLRFEDPHALLAWLVDNLASHGDQGYEIPIQLRKTSDEG